MENLMENLTLDECIHIFENSKLTSENFTNDAVCAAYVNALAALYAMKEKEGKK